MMRLRLAFMPLLVSVLAFGAMGAGRQHEHQQSSAQAQSAASQSGASQTSAAQNPAAQAASAANAGAASAAIPSYPDSPKGLEELMKKMLALKKSGDDKDLAPYIESLKLPDSDAFFRSTFGDQVGARLARDYASAEASLTASFDGMVAELNSKHLTHPQAVLFTRACDANATDAEYQVLFSRKNQQPLYDVRLRSESQSGIISYFAYVDGAFRFIGNIRLRLPDSQIIDVPPKSLTAKLVNRVVPVYPVDAKIRGVQGTVLLKAIIGPQGDVCSLRVIQGNPMLVGPAVSAVRQWTYSPTFVAGKPVAVNTTITVTFNLAE